jgi:hypothetical protein
MTLPEEDVELGTTTSPTVGVIGGRSNVFDATTIGEVVSEEIKVVEKTI